MEGTATRSERTITLDLEGMTCASCAARIERKLNQIGGVRANVNLLTEQATVQCPPDTDVERLVDAVEATGYHARPADVSDEEPAGGHHHHDEPAAALRRRLVTALVLTVPLGLLAMVPPLQFSGWEWIALALATPVVFFGGIGFHRATMQSGRHGAATMDTLVSLGTLSAWLWSTVVLVGGLDADTYFEVAAVITTLILLGRQLEARARRRSGEAIRALLALGAREARVIRDGREVTVPIDQLEVGDRFVVKPGEKIATDGVVAAGESAVDLSMLTGEAAPVEVGPGDEGAGATINTYGRVLVRATRVGADTALAQIARMVDQAQSGKAAVQRLAGRVPSVFVPNVIVP